jgi:hypothetical protein
MDLSIYSVLNSILVFKDTPHNLNMGRNFLYYILAQ